MIDVLDKKYWYWTYRNEDEKRLKIGYEYLFNWKLYENDLKNIINEKNNN